METALLGCCWHYIFCRLFESNFARKWSFLEGQRSQTKQRSSNSQCRKQNKSFPAWAKKDAQRSLDALHLCGSYDDGCVPTIRSLFTSWKSSTGFNFLSHGSQDLYPTYVKDDKQLTGNLPTKATIIGNCVCCLIRVNAFGSLTWRPHAQGAVVWVLLLSPSQCLTIRFASVAEPWQERYPSSLVDVLPSCKFYPSLTVSHHWSIYSSIFCCVVGGQWIISLCTSWFTNFCVQSRCHCCFLFLCSLHSFVDFTINIWWVISRRFLHPDWCPGCLGCGEFSG